MSLIWCSRKLGHWLDKILGSWLNDGSSCRNRNSRAIDFRKNDGVVNLLLKFIFEIPFYQRFMQHNFTPWLNPEKLTPVTKRFIFLFSLSYVIVLFITVVVISLCLWPLFTDKSGMLVSSNILSTFTAIGTMGAAYYAGRSAKSMVVSNNNSKANSEAESVDRRFSTLLEQHNNYLNLINAALRSKEMLIFSPQYMGEMSLEQGLRILRGENNEFFVKEGKLSTVTPDDQASHDAIAACNFFAKNTLSPYMRILYHTLKTIKEGCGKNFPLASENEKQYTNIVRSVIPNDVLFLVAVNSVAFYRDDRSIFSYMASKIEMRIYNDYAKYFFLLRRYAFFEHLNLAMPENYPDNIFGVCHFDDEILRGIKNISGGVYAIEDSGRRKTFLLKDDGVDFFSDLMRCFAKAVKKENLISVLFSFYELDERNKIRKNLYLKFLHALVYVAQLQSDERKSENSKDNQRVKKLYFPGVRVNYEDKTVSISTIGLSEQIFGDINIS